jgi:hypothetical protein
LRGATYSSVDIPSAKVLSDATVSQFTARSNVSDGCFKFKLDDRLTTDRMEKKPPASKKEEASRKVIENFQVGCTRPKKGFFPKKFLPHKGIFPTNHGVRCAILAAPHQHPRILRYVPTWRKQQCMVYR